MKTKTRKTPAGTNTAAKQRTAPTVGKNQTAELDVTLPKQVINWFRAAPHERYPLAAMVGVYGGGTALNAIHASPNGIGAAALVSVCGIVAASRKIKDGARAFKTCTLAVGTGIWVTIAGMTGTIGTDAPHIAMTAGFGVLSGAAYFTYRRDDHIKDRINKRKQREAWPEFAHKVGIGGSFVESRDDTRLGERMVVDTRGTSRRASSIASGNDLAERVAEYYGLAVSRVSVTLGRRAGQIVISIRRRDPWAKPIPHPLLDASPEINLPRENDITAGPAVVGQEPETGQPLTIPLWDEDGARRIMVIATPGSGKTVLLNNLIERITASGNAIVLGADLTKAKELRRWRKSGAVPIAACGPDDVGKAALILAAGEKAIQYRSANNDEKVFVPTKGRPAIFLVLDEIDGLVGGQSMAAQKARERLAYIVSKGRSESVGVILVGQRGTAKWLGGADIRNIIDTIVLGAVARPSEVRMAIGDVDLGIPDMSKYGEGKKGVIVIKELLAGISSGRTFRLDDLDDIEKIGTGRAPSPLEPGLVEHLGDIYTELVGEQPPVRAGDAETVAKLDAEVEAVLPDELREQWQATAEKIDDVKRYSAEFKPVEHDPRVDDIIADRQRQFVEDAKAKGVPADARETILRLAADASGVKNKTLADALKVDRATVFRYLTALKAEGVVEMRGRSRATAWFLVTDSPDDAESDDAQ
jgi:hypothetical protein